MINFKQYLKKITSCIHEPSLIEWGPQIYFWLTLSLFTVFDLLNPYSCNLFVLDKISKHHCIVCKSTWMKMMLSCFPISPLSGRASRTSSCWWERAWPSSPSSSGAAFPLSQRTPWEDRSISQRRWQYWMWQIIIQGLLTYKQVWKRFCKRS